MKNIKNKISDTNKRSSGYKNKSNLQEGEKIIIIEN